MRKPEHDWEQGIDRAFYMPTRADEGVRAYRNWVRIFLVKAAVPSSAR